MVLDIMDRLYFYNTHTEFILYIPEFHASTFTKKRLFTPLLSRMEERRYERGNKERKRGKMKDVVYAS